MRITLNAYQKFKLFRLTCTALWFVGLIFVVSSALYFLTPFAIFSGFILGVTYARVFLMWIANK